MADNIVFVQDWFAEVESAPGRMRQVAFRRGARVRAEIQPVANGDNPAEMADLRLVNGMTARHVPLARIAVDTRKRAA